MTRFTIRKLVSLSAVGLLGLTLAAAPALAEKGGNGGGRGSGKGGGNAAGSSASQGSSARASKAVTLKSAKSPKLGTSKATAKVAKAQDKSKVKLASSLGKLNGFIHASDSAFDNTSPDSAIGKVLYGYGDLLNAYLSPPVDGTIAPTPEELAAALAAAGNKPLTAEAIAAVNARLLSYSTTLAENLETSGKTAEDLAKEIADAM
jgi:hypothetical protein